ncbi:hypothetical protein AB0L99_30890 [Streptomyces sp. NPDC051954]|uniref:hypothetical protein n=1 Tax=Streptomyces sp. NPDC051954 TaxID=3155524 RepID=UPI003425AB4A
MTLSSIAVDRVSGLETGNHGKTHRPESRRARHANPQFLIIPPTTLCWVQLLDAERLGVAQGARRQGWGSLQLHDGASVSAADAARFDRSDLYA